MKNSISLAAILISALAMPAAVNAQTMEEVLVSAYNKSPRLKAQRSQLRIVDETYVQARSAGRLSTSIDGRIGGTYSDRVSTNVLGGSSADWSVTDSAGLNVTQPIYQGGRVSGLKEQARSNVYAGREELRAAEQSVLLSAAEAWLDVVRDEEIAKYRRQSVMNVSEQLTAFEEQFKFGEGTKTDIAQAKTRLEQAHIGLAAADANLAASRAAFKRETGQIPQQLSVPIETEMPADLEEAINIALAENPNLDRIEFTKRASEAAVKIAKSSLRPGLAVNSQIRTGKSDFSNLPRSSSVDLVAQVTIPLYAGGLYRSQIRAAKEEQNQIRYEMRDLENAIRQTVAEVWAQREAASLTRSAAEKQVAAAKEAYKGVRTEFTVGTRDALDVLNAEQELLRAEVSKTQSDRDYYYANYLLSVIMGRFSARDLGLPVSYYDPDDNFRRVIRTFP